MSEALRSYREIKDDYAYDGDPFCPDTQKVRLLKYIVQERLDAADRVIWNLYCELASVRKMEKVLHCSRGSTHKELVRIRKTILEEYERIRNNSTDSGDSGLHH